LLDRLPGQFTALALGVDAPDVTEVDGVPVGLVSVDLATDDPHGMVRDRYLGDAPGAVYLLRPDQHVVARWPQATAADVIAAVQTALGKNT